MILLIYDDWLCNVSPSKISRLYDFVHLELFEIVKHNMIF